VLILASNIGLALNVHYCAGKVASVALSYKQEEPCNDHHKQAPNKHHDHAEKKACCAAKAENHKKCCKDDVVKLQDKSDGKVIVKSLQLDLSAYTAVTEWKPSKVFYKAPALVAQAPSFYCESHAPPLFKLYCRYILYA